MNSDASASVYRDMIWYLADPAARSLLLAAVAFVLLKVLRIRDLHLRLATWKAVLASAMAMPLLGWLLPARPLSISKTTVAPQILRSPAPPAVQINESGPRDVSFPRAIIVPMSPDYPRVPAERSIPLWPRIAAAIYILGASFLLTRFATGLYLSGRIRKRSRSIEDIEVQQSLARESTAASLRRHPELAESDAIAVPVTLGIPHPIILLPTEWRE